MVNDCNLNPHAASARPAPGWIRSLKALLLTLGIVLVAGCGKVSDAGADAQALRALASAAAASPPATDALAALAAATHERRRALANEEVDAEDAALQLFDLAERVLPQMFPGRERTRSFDTWYYRYYASTGMYVAVINGGVYVLGGALGPEVVFAGRVSALTPLRVTRPTASAGAAQIVLTGALVVLDGSASSDPDGERLTYSWTLVTRPAGSTATLTGATTVAPTFIADQAGSYTAALVVTDGRLVSQTALVNIRAGGPNVAPVANAGLPQTVVAGTEVALDGTGSSDANGDPLSYNWSITARPTGSNAQLSFFGAPNPRFTADVAGTYVVALVVSDGRLESPTSTVTITVQPVNNPPVARAGDSRTVPVGTRVALDGRGSTDPDGDPLTYSWTLSNRPTGSSAVLASPTTSEPSFTADTAGTYLVTLVVADSRNLSAATSITITAVSNSPPVANAGAAQRALAPGTVVELDGRNSTDPESRPLTYRWTLTAKPTGSTAAFGSSLTSTAARPTFVVDRVGSYVATLVVNDGQLDSAPATVTVTAVPLFGFASAFEPSLSSYAASASYVSVTDDAGGVQVTRIEIGKYKVLFPGLGRRGTGIRFVTMASTVSLGNVSIQCMSAAPSVNGSDVEANVVCTDPLNRQIDSKFNVLVFGEQAVGGLSGFTDIDVAAVSGPAPINSWTSTGSTIVVTRPPAGGIQLDFGLGTQFGDRFQTFVGSLGSTQACQGNQTDNRPTVICYNQTDAQVDANFTAVMLGAGRPGRGFGMAAGFLTNQQPPGISLDGRFTVNTGGGPVGVSRLGLGFYRFSFGGLNNGVAKAVIVRSAQSLPLRCALLSFGDGGIPSSTDYIVDVHCHDRLGSLVDGSVSVMVIE